MEVTDFILNWVNLKVKNEFYDNRVLNMFRFEKIYTSQLNIVVYLFLILSL
jgi:hypothetical protein